jgi:hypothetical protein
MFSLLTEHLVDDDGADGRVLCGLLLLLSIKMRMRLGAGSFGWLVNLVLPLG